MTENVCQTKIKFILQHGAKAAASNDFRDDSTWNENNAVRCHNDGA